MIRQDIRYGTAIVGVAISLGCAAGTDSGGESFIVEQSNEPLLVATPSEAAAVLALVNRADQQELDLRVRLDARAARNIVAHRQGPDRRDGTSDDDPIDTLDELDGISYVGTRAFAKLLEYARAEGYFSDPSEDCLIVSEYIEAGGRNNKALELFNCGETPLVLADFGVCLQSNDDDGCTRSDLLRPLALAPGNVFTLCRTDEGSLADPLPGIRLRCDQTSSTMNFNGDDRLVVFRDDDLSLSYEPESDALMDAFGQLGVRPSGRPWEDVTLRRCRFEPTSGGSDSDPARSFSTHPVSDVTDFGFSPGSETCR